MPSANKKKVTFDSKKQAKVDTRQVQKWANKQSEEKLNKMSIDMKDQSNAQKQMIDLQNAIELEKIGIPEEYVDSDLLPPKLIRQKAREILYPEVAKGQPTREELIRAKLNRFTLVKDDNKDDSDNKH